MEMFSSNLLTSFSVNGGIEGGGGWKGGRISLTGEGRRRRFIVFLRTLMKDDSDTEIKFI